MGFETSRRVVQIRNNQQCTETVGGKTCHFRSLLEFRYARYLEFLKVGGAIQNWFYERTKFVFPDEMTGAKQCLIDFDVIENDGSLIHHETKGHLTGPDNTKFRRIAKYYPKARIHLVMQNLPGPKAKTGTKISGRLRIASKYCERILSFTQVTRGLV